MAASRKLQADIEKHLKKVDEGVEEFRHLWDAVHSAANENQREKFESEMKTSIKKLQRDRDQIKTWQGDKSVKDKNGLAEAKKKIETEMARFKEFERDAKTKAYSTMALTRAGRMDPHEQEKLQHRQWIQEYIDKLHMQIDELDVDIEAKKGKTKKGKSSEDAEGLHLKFVQDSHRWHATKLEQLLRKLDNDDVNVEEFDDLKENVMYYVDDQPRTPPSDFQPWNEIYESFQLDDVEDYVTKDRARASTGLTDGDREADDKKPSADKDAAKDDDKEKEKEKAKADPPPKAPTKRTGGAANNAAASSAAAASSRAGGRGRAKETAEAPEASAAPAHKPWPPVTSVWHNPAPPPTPAPPAPEREKAPPPTVVPKAAQVTTRPVPTAPPPVQHAPERPPGAPPAQPPPNQPPPKPAPPAPAMQPPAQAPPQPPLPAPPAGNPPRQAVAGGGSMPPPPSMAPPAPTAPMNCPPEATMGPGSMSPTEGPPSTAPPPPPPPPLLPPPPPAPAIPSTMGAPPPTVPSPPLTHAKSPPPAVSGKEPPAQRPPPAPFAPEDRVPHVHHAPKVPPPSEAPPPPTESPPPPPSESVPSPPTEAVPPPAPVPAASAVVGPPVPSPMHRESLRSTVQQPPPGPGAAIVAPTAAPAHQGHGVFEGSTAQANNFSAAAMAAAHATMSTYEAVPGLEATSALSPRSLQNLEKLANSHRHMPFPSDRRSNRKYVPRTPYVHVDTRHTPAYPMQPTRGYDDPAEFEKYDLDTLFFIFYFQQGSYQQHLAAKELKKLSWRYHTKYMTWFQRHEEPFSTASDYERGAYLYFDHESGWIQRVKGDFTFEYRFLEEELS